MKAATWTAEEIEIQTSDALLRGDLNLALNGRSLVIFAHGSGSGRKSSRNRFVAHILQEHGLGTLLFDLLTMEEERVDARTAEFRFDIPLLARRLEEVTDWAQERWPDVVFGYFGASTGAAAALIAAARHGQAIRAVVSRGGRPDLAREELPNVTAPVLMIVGGRDEPVIALNQTAFAQLRCEKHLEIVPGATHLFEEPGTLEKVSILAANWFELHFFEK